MSLPSHSSDILEASLQEAARRTIKAIVVGASAGGIDALLALFARLPRAFSLPVIALLHMAEHNESRLAEVFQHHVGMKVKDAEDKETIVPGTLYFAVPGYHLSIEKEYCFSLSCEPPVNFSRPSIDILMGSAADAYGPQVAGILLTGANHDGAEGMRQIGIGGGLTIIQDPKEAQVGIMPAEAIRLRQPDFVLPLFHIHQLCLALERTNAARSQH